MGRRSDHTRTELEQLLLDKGSQQLAEVGLARLSARDVAKQVGYSVGSLYNVFGSYDGLVLAINARTLARWAEFLRARLAKAGEDRIACLVQSYFQFAADHTKAWLAIYEHHLVEGAEPPDWYVAAAADLVGIVVNEIEKAVTGLDPEKARGLALSLVATVHGHCVFALYRTFDVMGEIEPVDTALARVREALAAATP